MKHVGIGVMTKHEAMVFMRFYKEDFDDFVEGKIEGLKKLPCHKIFNKCIFFRKEMEEWEQNEFYPYINSNAPF